MYFSLRDIPVGMLALVAAVVGGLFVVGPPPSGRPEGCQVNRAPDGARVVCHAGSGRYRTVVECGDGLQYVGSWAVRPAASVAHCPGGEHSRNAFHQSAS